MEKKTAEVREMFPFCATCIKFSPEISETGEGFKIDCYHQRVCREAVARYKAMEELKKSNKED